VSGRTESDKERRRRWFDDCRFITIAAAPPGWWALTTKDPSEVALSSPDRGTIYDYAYVEAVACFALVEEVLRLELLNGEDDWELTELVDPPPGQGFPHTRIVPVAWHSGEGHFPGADEFRDYRFGWDYLVTPPTQLDHRWLVEEFRGRVEARAKRQVT